MSWSIPGAEGEPILGNTHGPDVTPAGVIVIAHGFKGYKDYGMFPRIARHCAERGLIAHRFNFSHSGMTDNLDTFERPDLFERDTWNKQVLDVRAVMGAVADGSLDGGGLPIVLFGHSRGGVSVLLATGRHADDDDAVQPAGIVTAAAPSTCSSLTSEQSEELLSRGYLVSPSARTGQELRIGRGFLEEQRADPEGHDLVRQSARIRCPVLLVHGAEDPTVPAACAHILAGVIGNARAEIIPGADHVFNTPNPMPADAEPSPELQALLTGLTDFAQEVCHASPAEGGRSIRDA